MEGEEDSGDDSLTSESECGVILSVHLENFRCHEKLKLDLNPNINFILGDNGSGKSSILSAIQIALGSNGKTTGQGNAFKKFVKYGAKNVGGDAFKFETYGPEIMIERKIGSVSTFELCNSQGRKVKTAGTAKEEVIQIRDQFNLQVENPIMIMTQERQKQFITASPNLMFNFFEDATQLRDIESAYSVVEKDIAEIEESITRTEQEELPLAEERFKTTEAAYQAVAHLEELQEKINEVQCQCFWKQVDELESEHDQLKIVAQRKEQSMLGLQGNEDERKQEILSLKEQLAVKKIRLGEAETQAEAGIALSKAAKATKEGFEQKYKGKRNLVKRVGREIDQLKNERTQYDRQISDLHNKGDSASSAESDRLMVERTELEQQIAPAKEVWDASKLELFSIAKDVEQLDDNLKRASGYVKEQKHELQNKEKECHRVKQSTMNKVFKFLSGNGKQAQDLMHAIQHERKWEKRPIGPLGLHIKVNDPSWTVAVESCIGGILNTFVCDNPRDRSLLQSILRKHSDPRQKPTIVITSRFGPRYRTQRPAADVLTVEDMITCDNDAVFNTLVDMANIDRTVLCDDRDRAQHLLKTNKDFTRIFLKSDGQLLSMRYGSMAFGIPTIEAKACKLSANQEAYLHHLEGQLAVLRTQLDEAAARIDSDQSERSELKEKHTQLKRSSLSSRKSFDGMTQRKLQISARFDEIQRELEEDEGIGGMIQAIMDSKRDVESQVAEAEKRQDDCKRELSQAEAEKNAAEAEAERILNDAIQRIEETGSATLSNEIAEISRAIADGEHDLKYKYNQRSELDRELTRRSEELVSQKNTIEEKTSLAIKAAEIVKLDQFSSKPASISALKSSIQLAKQIELMKKRLRERQDGVNVQEVYATYVAAKKLHENLTTRRNKQRWQLEGFISDLACRKKKQKKTRRAVEKTLRHKQYMNVRNHHGVLTVNYKDKTLSFDVTVAGSGMPASQQGGSEPNPKKQKRGTDTKTLSGGEKAFTTVAFLLALGEAMECPVRGKFMHAPPAKLRHMIAATLTHCFASRPDCLVYAAMDEFDCFMDAANRNVSVQQLIGCAKIQSHRQFLFLTPLSMTQSINALKGDPMVQIVNLKSPKDQ